MSESAYHKMRSNDAVAPAGCPVNHGFSPYEPGYLADPYGALKQLREDTPVFYAEELGYLVVTRMEDVAEVFRDFDTFSSENVQDPVLPICPAAVKILEADDYNPIAVLSNRQKPDHTRIRKHALAGFSGRRMRLLEPYVRKRCEIMVDAMLAGEKPAEFVAAVGHPLPGETIFRLIGFSEDDDRRLKDWTTDRLAFTWGKATDEEQVEIAENMLAYWRHCVDFVAHRQANPADDFTSELLAVHDKDPAQLSYNEVVSVVYGLSFAGHEIVTNFLSNGLICLLSRREQWDEVCADPSLINNALEEILRHNSPQTSWRRVATKDTEIAGHKIPAGTQIFLSLAAANHDSALYAEPEEFDIHRDNARTHISFGRGAHFCLGNRLALLEGRIALEVLSAKVPSLDLIEGQKLSYFPNFTFRGPKELWLTWGG